MDTDLTWPQHVVLAAVAAGEDIYYLTREQINARAPQGAAGITTDTATQLAQQLEDQGLVETEWVALDDHYQEYTAAITDQGRAALVAVAVAALRRTLANTGRAASATITTEHPDHPQGYTGHYQVQRITTDQRGTWLHCTQHPDDDGEHAGMAATLHLADVQSIRPR